VRRSTRTPGQKCASDRAVAAIYNLYSRRILPLLGGRLTGNREAYGYLPESVRKFPDAPQLAADRKSAGFHSVEFEYLTGGIARAASRSKTRLFSRR
jgi:ubiquinone/menaquinone biosynthesis C-methylase UbiE